MLISHEELKRLFHYDPETGLWTRLVKIHPGQTAVGKPIGAVHRHGYVHFSIGARKYLGHRLAWFYMTGQWPTKNIDHKDGNPANNRWENLREATQEQNTWNARTPKNNKTGLKGVYWCKKDECYIANIKRKNKSSYLGRSECPAVAHFLYIIAADIRGRDFARAR